MDKSNFKEQCMKDGSDSGGTKELQRLLMMKVLLMHLAIKNRQA